MNFLKKNTIAILSTAFLFGFFHNAFALDIIYFTDSDVELVGVAPVPYISFYATSTVTAIPHTVRFFARTNDYDENDLNGLVFSCQDTLDQTQLYIGNTVLNAPIISTSMTGYHFSASTTPFTFFNGTTITAGRQYFCSISIFKTPSNAQELDNSLFMLGGLVYPHFVIYDSGGSAVDFGDISGVIESDFNKTRFTSIFPLDKANVATSSFYTFEIYVAPEDFSSGMYVEVNKTNAKTIATGGPVISSMGLSIFFPILASGNSSYSTTTTYSQFGEQYITYSIKDTEGFLAGAVRFVGFGGFLPSLVQKNYTYYFNGSFLDSFLATATKLTDGVKCDIFITPTDTFGDCLYSLFFPSVEQLDKMGKDIQSAFSSHFPFAYVYRTIAIFSNTTAIKPPPISYTFGTSAPPFLQGKGFSFQPFDSLGLISTFRADDGSNQNIWQIFMPYFKVLVSLGVLGVILEDLLGFRFASGVGSVADDVDRRKSIYPHANSSVPRHIYSRRKLKRY